MTRDEIYQAIKPIIQTVTGLNMVTIVDAVDDRGVGLPSPPGEYITIEPKQSVAQRGQANIHRKNSTLAQSVDYDIRTQIIVELNINCFRGQDAISRLSRLQQCNKRPDVSNALRAAKLGWQRVSAPNNLTRLQSGNPEQRAQIYIYLYYETTDEITINSIESASYGIEYEDGTVVATGSVPD